MRRPYSDTLYPTSFNLDSPPAPRISVLRKIYGLCFTLGPTALGYFSCDSLFWDDRGGVLTGQSMGPQVDTANIRTVLSTNHVDSRSFSPRCWAFRRTHPSADPIRLLGIRLALPLTLSLPSGFLPSTKLMVGASPRALGLVKDFSCDGMFWDESGGGLAPVDPRVDTATIRTVLSTNRVDSGSFSSGCCAFRRTHTSADPIRLLCIRLALPLSLPLPSRFAPSARLTVGGTPCALWLVEFFFVTACFGKIVEEDLLRNRWVQQP